MNTEEFRAWLEKLQKLFLDANNSITLHEALLIAKFCSFITNNWEVPT